MLQTVEACVMKGRRMLQAVEACVTERERGMLQTVEDYVTEERGIFAVIGNVTDCGRLCHMLAGP